MRSLTKSGYKGRKIAPSCGGVKTQKDIQDSFAEEVDVYYFNLIYYN